MVILKHFPIFTSHFIEFFNGSTQDIVPSLSFLLVSQETLEGGTFIIGNDNKLSQ